MRCVLHSAQQWHGLPSHVRITCAWQCPGSEAVACQAPARLAAACEPVSFLQAVDISKEALERLQASISEPSRLLTIVCDVTRDREQAAAFAAHMQRWDSLDMAVLCAGIGESGELSAKSGVSRHLRNFAHCLCACATAATSRLLPDF
jgi:NADP-dependent 3-hydroxy acid dehydrogenase YdfG